MLFSANIKAAKSSNDILLSPDIRDFVKQSIAQLEESVDELEEEIARLHAIRRGKLVELEELHTAISSQRLLPPEVLSLVFEYAHLMQAPERKFLSCPYDLQPHLSPWNLRQVCSHWRSVALSCHPLWHAVSVEWQDIAASLQRTQSQHSLPDLRPLFDLWNRRLSNAREVLPTSGNVHIHVSTTATEWDTTVDVLRNAFVMLVKPFLGRLQTLSYECPATSTPLFRELHQISFESVGPLESIALRFPQKSASLLSLPLPTPPPSEDFRLGGLTQLCHLEISGEDDWLCFLLHHRFPWENLITFKVSFTRLFKKASKDMALVLAQCNNLEHLEVESSYRTTSSHVVSCKDRILLPQLKTLRISSYRPDMLKSVATPSLVSLVLACHIFLVDEVIQFLRDSNCQLQAFKEEQPYPQRPPNQNRQVQYLRMLDFMKSVKIFQTSVVLNANGVRPLASGQLLPNVEQLRFSTDMPLPVLNIINSGFKAASRDIPVRGIVLEVVVEIDGRKASDMNAVVRDLKSQHGVDVEVELHLGIEWYSHRDLLEP